MGPARETEGEHDYVKNKRRLNALKEEVESVTRKIRELTDEELEQVTGGKWYSHEKDKDVNNFRWYR